MSDLVIVKNFVFNNGGLSALSADAACELHVFWHYSLDQHRPTKIATTDATTRCTAVSSAVSAATRTCHSGVRDPRGRGHFAMPAACSGCITATHTSSSPVALAPVAAKSANKSDSVSSVSSTIPESVHPHSLSTFMTSNEIYLKPFFSSVVQCSLVKKVNCNYLCRPVLVECNIKKSLSYARKSRRVTQTPNVRTPHAQRPVETEQMQRHDQASEILHSEFVLATNKRAKELPLVQKLFFHEVPIQR